MLETTSCLFIMHIYIIVAFIVLSNNSVTLDCQISTAYIVYMVMLRFVFFVFSSRRRHTRCALVTGVQTCALPIWIVPPGRGADRPRIARHDQAFIAAPAEPDAEMRQCVDESRPRAIVGALQGKAEQPAGAGEIARPQRMAGIVRQPRMEHPPDLCPRREPARDRKPVLAVPLQAHVERPQAAQYQGAIVGRNRMAKLIARLAQPRPQRRRRSQRPHHRVRMAADRKSTRLNSSH